MNNNKIRYIEQQYNALLWRLGVGYAETKPDIGKENNKLKYYNALLKNQNVLLSSQFGLATSN